MADLSDRARNSVELQREVFRLAEKEHGLSVAVIARTRDLSYSTVKGWKDGAAMPAWALGELDLPDDLTSLLLQPYHKHVGTDVIDGEGDCDALGLEALGLASEVASARHPDSPGGVNIVPLERARIGQKARRLTPKARALSAA